MHVTKSYLNVYKIKMSHSSNIEGVYNQRTSFRRLLWDLLAQKEGCRILS